MHLGKPNMPNIWRGYRKKFKQSRNSIDNLIQRKNDATYNVDHCNSFLVFFLSVTFFCFINDIQSLNQIEKCSKKVRSHLFSFVLWFTFFFVYQVRYIR